jgi:radical SAM superfamily enzyme YgiQ (UPF0313 family)
MGRYPQVDAIVRKEAEVAMGNLLSNLRNMAEVRGITYREGEQIIRNEDESSIKDLDSLPFPALHLAKMEKYFAMADRYEFHLRSPSSSLMTSRGCIGKCTYCASPFLWPKLRVNSPGYVIKNIKYQQKKYGIRDFKIFDDHFPVSKLWMRKFFKLAKDEKIDISYRCMGRADLIDDELLGMMKETGCYYIDFGIESGSQDVLDKMKKSITLEQIERAVRLTRKHKIMRGAFFMLGVKGETSKDLIKTIELARSLPLSRACFSQTRLYPGTKMYEDANIDPAFWFKGSKEKDVYNAPAQEADGYSNSDMAKICKCFGCSAGKKHFFSTLWLFFRTRRKIPKIIILLAALKQLVINAFSYDKEIIRNLYSDGRA